MELGLIEKREQRYTRADILRKGIALLAFVFIFAVVLKQFNGADTFWKGFRDSYLIWLIIDWYDALILDCIWFCHSRCVKETGCAVCLDGALSIHVDPDLCFRQILPEHTTRSVILWKKNHLFSQAASLFVQTIQEY